MKNLALWFVGGAGLIVLLLYTNYAFFNHLGNVDSTANVTPLEGSMSLGILRGEVNDDGILNPVAKTLDIKEIEDNILSKISIEQKNNLNDIDIIYSFVDKDGKEVNWQDESTHKDIRGVQYAVSYTSTNKNGETRRVSTSERMEIQNILTEE